MQDTQLFQYRQIKTLKKNLTLTKKKLLVNK